MTNRVTEHQMMVFDAILRLNKRGNMEPTYREVAAECGKNLAYVFRTVHSLKKKGVLIVRSGQKRTIKIPPKLARARYAELEAEDRNHGSVGQAVEA